MTSTPPTQLSSTAAAATDAPPAFARILGGIDGSRADREVAAQAAILAGGEAVLTLAAVTWRVGFGPTEMAELDPRRAEHALDQAERLARELGAAPACQAIESPDATAALIEQAGEHDLLVVGGHPRSRAGGIFLGSTATAAVHRASVPVLIARRPPADAPFPEKLLLASDGSEGSRRAAGLAARIARRHGSSVLIAHVADDGDHLHRRAMAEDAADIQRATGSEPVTVSETGSPADRIVALAEQHGVSLVVIGSSGRTGIKALGSVSERVAHRARCSVLVARPVLRRP